MMDLLDHLVGKREQAIWHREPQSLGGLEVEHQVELGRLLSLDALRQMFGIEEIADTAP